MSEDYRIQPIRFDTVQLARYQVLFNACFPPLEKFSPHALQWLYGDNPDGEAVGFDAYLGEELAAHYVCVPARVALRGKAVRGLLSLNTATHPAHQGKGLFTRLAEATYAEGARRGFACVYGVANANSTPGFIRKLQFQNVCALEAQVGFGHLNIQHELGEANTLDFARVWSPEALAWRCANPAAPVTHSARAERSSYTARGLNALVHAYAETSPRTHASAHHPFGMRLHLGLTPAAQRRNRFFFDIPQRFRPSPLNFIFRALAPEIEAPRPDFITFSFLDFDAY
jgi:GNAT superfamily N-acetyltransferase